MADFGEPTHKIGDGFLVYIRQILSKEPLSNKETLGLFEQYRQGDELAFQKIAEGNLWLVVKCAVSNFGAGVTLEDLIQEGNLGLIRAIQSFDSKKHLNFISYANKCIYQSIRDAYSFLPHLIRIPSYQLAIYKKIHKFKHDFELKNGYEPTLKQIDIGEEVSKDMLEYLYLLPDNLNDIIVDVDPDTLDNDIPQTNTLATFTKRESKHKKTSQKSIKEKQSAMINEPNFNYLDDVKSITIHVGDRLLYNSRPCTVKKIHNNGIIVVTYNNGVCDTILFHREKGRIKKVE